MRRVQIHLEEDLDLAAAEEAKRRGISNAALVRASLAKELQTSGPDPDAAWAAITGWLQDGGVGKVDDVVFGPARRSSR